MDVFISYSSMESDIAQEIREVLKKNDITIWMAPESIPWGSNYTKEIPVAIKQCKVFLLVLSETSQNSLWVLAELEQAFKNRKYILPYVDEEIELNDEFDFLISRSQRFVANKNKEQVFKDMVTRIKMVLETEKNPEGSLPCGIGEETVGDDIQMTVGSENDSPKDTENTKLPEVKKHVYENGDVYEGEYINGKKGGNGRYIWANGDMFEGYFVADAFFKGYIYNSAGEITARYSYGRRI